MEINKTEGKNNLSYLKVEITRTSISGKKSEHIVVYPFTGILLRQYKGTFTTQHYGPASECSDILNGSRQDGMSPFDSIHVKNQNTHNRHARQSGC